MSAHPVQSMTARSRRSLVASDEMSKELGKEGAETGVVFESERGRGRDGGVGARRSDSGGRVEHSHTQCSFESAPEIAGRNQHKGGREKREWARATEKEAR